MGNSLSLDLLTADRLDGGRKAGKLRGPLHGIPIIIKLLGNGSINVGKSNLSEFSNYRRDMLPSGWSAVGGQTQSAYVRGGVDPNDIKDGHSSPSGSSSGSAVAVSASYAPWSIGTETDGSLICPAGRAALYTIKPTIGLVPQAGIVPVSRNFDSADSISFMESLTGSWEDIAVAVLDPETWKFPDSFVKPVSTATEQILRDIRSAYAVIKSKAKSFVENAPFITTDAFDRDHHHNVLKAEHVTEADLKKELEAYLQGLDEAKVRTLQDIIDFNKQYSEKALPPLPAQKLSEGEYERDLKHLTHVSRDLGIDRILKEFNVDVIIGPADSFITSLATGSGYPVAGMPLSYLDFNGRPLGLAALAGKGQDAPHSQGPECMGGNVPPTKTASSTYREITGPAKKVQTAPLFLCDASSIEPQDMAPCDVVSSNYAGNSVFLYHSERHRWFWFGD
ncbi:putative amidase [Podospora aff. communis PSN243]|uniref:Amidase n=1 Tax=Podospora aff. communis PSN243 TaxID=3040156 RepID=A0AAV9GGW8_9PEZI|nr:putative amidase [Podospora aff. communis PSN243]